MKIKKQKMMEKFEKLLKKGKLTSKEEFYKQIFNNDNEGYSKNYIKNLDPYDSKSFNEMDDLNRSNDNNNYKPYQVEENNHEKSPEKKITASIEEIPKKPTMSNQKKENLNEMNTSRKEENNLSVKYLTEEDVNTKVEEKRAELEHNLYDMITRNEVNEKKLLEEIENIEKEDFKNKKMKEYEEEKDKNAQKVSQMRE